MPIINHYIKIHSIYKYAGRFANVEDFTEAVNLALQNRIKSEIIGHWLYCFTTSLIGVQLQAAGFWFSIKHYAYIFSGKPKDSMAYDETLDEIRARLGSYQIKSGK